MQDKAGRGTRCEQVAIAPYPIERVAPIGLAAYRGAVFFYIVDRQKLVDDDYLDPGQTAQAQDPLRVLMLFLAALEWLRLHERATDKKVEVWM